MTVGELRQALETFPADMLVLVSECDDDTSWLMGAESITTCRATPLNGCHLFVRDREADPRDIDVVVIE
jgi:hypothetical protein